MGRIVKIISVSLCLLVLISCSRKGHFCFFNETIEAMLEVSQDEGIPFCVVLHDSLFSSSDYTNKFLISGATNNHVLINFINIDEVENEWYYKVLRPQVLPTTCIFDDNGNLVDIVPGAGIESLKYIHNSIHTLKPNFDFHFNQKYEFEKLKLIDYFNSIFKLERCIQDYDSYIFKVDSLLQINLHPYLLYLKVRRQISNNDILESRNAAREFLTLCNNPNDIVDYYSEYLELNSYLTPEYIEVAPIISVAQDTIELNNCKHNQQVAFNVTVTNLGSRALKVYDVLTGCSCINSREIDNFYLNPSEKEEFEFSIMPSRNDVGYRDIVFISNAKNGPTTFVKVKANVIN